MLANESSTPNFETELYDSGASRHMSPHRHRFINFTPITPKSITAADNGTFQATGVFAGSVVETVSADELHRRMGHIAPEAAKRLVNDGLVTGIKLDGSSEIRSPCEIGYGTKFHRARHARAQRRRRTAQSDDLGACACYATQQQSPQIFVG
ncbi:hypothetical protein K438DRAFT_1839090, partial [Mycena galopus ATCC 62051]